MKWVDGDDARAKYVYEEKLKKTKPVAINAVIGHVN